MSEVVASVFNGQDVDLAIDCPHEDRFEHTSIQSAYRPFLCILPSTTDSLVPESANGVDESLEDVFGLELDKNLCDSSMYPAEGFDFPFSQPIYDEHNLGTAQDHAIDASYGELEIAHGLISQSAIDPWSTRRIMEVSASQSLTSTLPNVATSSMPGLASFLLEHYRNQMIMLFSPRESPKSPWKILHLPSVMSTFSELLINAAVSPGRSALFYSILSASAFNFDKRLAMGSDMSDLFWKFGDDFHGLAKAKLKQALPLQPLGPKVSKYKDTLMALLTMLSISVISGQQHEARKFLLDTEQFISICGISKEKKSRKVRLLHQIYVFLRVIEESTHLYSQVDCGGASEQQALLLYSSLNGPFPSLKTQAALNGRDLDEIGGRAFHEELLGDSFSTSMFQDIYGIPLGLFSLISQTTAIANIMKLGVGLPDPARGEESLPHRVSELEDDIHSWRNEVKPSLYPPQDTETTMMRHLILAFYNATIIYFYRRIYDVHPGLLQPYVLKVYQNLASIEQEKLQSNRVYNGIAWPAFMAAAEALDSSLQQALYDWLINSAIPSGFRNFDVAAHVAKQIWRAREKSVRVSWVNLVSDQQIVLVMT